jgi:alcohol dehydrogenase
MIAGASGSRSLRAKEPEHQNVFEASVSALRRGGSFVTMGSITVDLPVPYLQRMINSLEISGNFMHPRC